MFQGFKTLISSKKRNNLQEEQNDLKAVLLLCRERGFPLSRIRKALLVLNGTRNVDLKTDRVSLSALSRTINGQNIHDEAALQIVKALNLTTNDLFPNERRPAA